MCHVIVAVKLYHEGCNHVQWNIIYVILISKKEHFTEEWNWSNDETAF